MNVLQTESLVEEINRQIKACLGHNIRKFGKKRAILIQEVVAQAFFATCQGKDAEERRDILFEIFREVELLNRLSHTQ